MKERKVEEAIWLDTGRVLTVGYVINIKGNPALSFMEWKHSSQASIKSCDRVQISQANTILQTALHLPPDC